MSTGTPNLRWKAMAMLGLATLSWGLSFPVIRALNLVQAQLLPQNSTWFFAAYIVVVRFSVASLLMALYLRRRLLQIHREEIIQGLCLAVFASMGLILQSDGLSYTHASTSAFLTQLCAFWLPLFTAIEYKRLPSLRVLAACSLMLWGVGLLSGFSWGHLHLGRGELETLACAFVFTFQILTLERPRFAKNDSMRVSFVMYLAMTLFISPFLFLFLKHPSDLSLAVASPLISILYLLLIVFCTLLSFGLMNTYQKYIHSFEAGIIYGFEPVFASVFALVLPGIFAQSLGIEYANEILTSQLKWGALLICGANVLIHIRFRKISHTI